jgi:hypothetical protein
VWSLHLAGRRQRSVTGRSRSGVRILPLAVAVSAGVHAAVVAWLTMRPPTPRPVDATATTTPIEIVTVDPAAALDVRLLEPAIEPPAIAPRDTEPPDDEPSAHRLTTRPATEPTERPTAPPPAIDDAPTRTAARPRGSSSSAATSVDAARPAEQPTPSGEPTRRNPLLAMRSGEVPRVALPAGRWDDLDHAPRGTGPARSASTGILQADGGGRSRSDQGGFTANVSPDGATALTDQPSFQIHLALPSPRALGRALADWYESDKGPHGAEGNTAMARQIQLSPGAPTEVPDPTDGRPKDRAKTVIIPVLAGRLEVTDWLMRRAGIDPYAARKLKMLDDTRDERAELRRQHHAEQLAMTPQTIQRSLEALWAATPDVAARKQALFELWDDCVETGDPAVVEAGAAARRMIIGFVRARLPVGSRDAFTDADLAALARTQHSAAAFQPYE